MAVPIDSFILGTKINEALFRLSQKGFLPCLTAGSIGLRLGIARGRASAGCVTPLSFS